MSENLHISTIETAEFLKGKYGSGVADVEAIGEGGWSVALAFVHNGARNVIRWSDVVDNFERDAVAASFTSNDLPIPPITELGRGLDRFYAISPFIEGNYLETLHAAELENTLPSIIKMLRALRAINLVGTSEFGFWNRASNCYRKSIQQGENVCTLNT